MLSSKFVKAMLLGVGMTLLTSVSAFAYTEEEKILEKGEVSIQLMAADPDTSVSSPAFIVSDEILARQAEIDVYLFKQHYEELKRAGIKVTHTAPMENHVEVGISPYTPENADYLIKALGAQQLKIVEGMEAVPVRMDIPENEGDKVYKTMEADESLMYMTGVADDAIAEDAQVDEAVVLRSGEPAENERDIYTTTAVEVQSGADKSDASALPLAGAAGGILLIGGSLLAMRKRKSAARS